MTVRAFDGDPARKAFYLDRIRAHEAADEIIKGRYWRRGKGCAIGCSIHGSSHAEFAAEFGVPESLARLHDAIFEELPNKAAKSWPRRFTEALVPGRDYSCVHWQFLHWLLLTELHGKHGPRIDALLAQVASVIEPATRGEPIDGEAARVASARAAEAARAAGAEATAWAAQAAWAAAEAAEAEAAAWAAAEAAEAAEAAYTRMSEALLAIIEDTGGGR